MLALWRRLRDLLGLGADSIQVLTYLAPAATAYAVLTALVGWIARIPWFYVMVGAPIAGFSLACGLAVIAHLRNPRRTYNLDEWIGHDSYYVWVAACLWVDVAPWPEIGAEHPAYPALQKIKGALDANVIEEMYGGHGMKGRVERGQLLKLAELTGARPPFLFPPKR